MKTTRITVLIVQPEDGDPFAMTYFDLVVDEGFREVRERIALPEADAQNGNIVEIALERLIYHAKERIKRANH